MTFLLSFVDEQLALSHLPRLHTKPMLRAAFLEWSGVAIVLNKHLKVPGNRHSGSRIAGQPDRIPPGQVAKGSADGRDDDRILF